MKGFFFSPKKLLYTSDHPQSINRWARGTSRASQPGPYCPTIGSPWEVGNYCSTELLSISNILNETVIMTAGLQGRTASLQLGSTRWVYHARSRLLTIRGKPDCSGLSDVVLWNGRALLSGCFKRVWGQNVAFAIQTRERQTGRIQASEY